MGLGVWSMRYRVLSHIKYQLSTTQAQPITSSIEDNTSNNCCSNGLAIPVPAKFQNFGKCREWKLHLPCRQNRFPKYDLILWFLCSWKEEERATGNKRVCGHVCSVARKANRFRERLGGVGARSRDLATKSGLRTHRPMCQSLWILRSIRCWDTS